jgi:hypothetical protein
MVSGRCVPLTVGTHHPQSPLIPNLSGARAERLFAASSMRSNRWIRSLIPSGPKSLNTFPKCEQHLSRDVCSESHWAACRSESFYDDEKFADRNLAALVTSKVCLLPFDMSDNSL